LKTKLPRSIPLRKKVLDRTDTVALKWGMVVALGWGMVVALDASELRAICEHLRPALVDNFGLEGALRARVRTLSRRYPGLTVSLTLDPECSDLEGAIGHACYRIVQEALSNVIQHSGASQAGIWLSREHTMCRLLITDNGRGFDLPKDWLKLVRDSHFGLVGMRERAEMQGGICRIDSAPGKGMRIEVNFPMPSLNQSG
jgi:signal transduction histidine kinase